MLKLSHVASLYDVIEDDDSFPEVDEQTEPEGDGVWS